MRMHVQYEVTDLDSVAELLTVLALDLRPVLGLWAIAREVTLVLAVAARDVVRVARLITLLGHVILRTAVATGTRRTSLNVRALWR